MIQNVILVALVLLAAQAIHLNQNYEVLKPGNVTLRSSTGIVLTLCHNCGGTKPDSAIITSPSGEPEQIWTLEFQGDKVAFKGSRGEYLARCNNCWKGAATKDAAFVYATTPDGMALWKPVLQPTGLYAFRSDSGNYLTACLYCANDQGANVWVANLKSNTGVNQLAQWAVDYV